MTDPVAIGRASHGEGKAFERRIADLYRLLHYQVEHGREFSSREVDLFLTRRMGDLTIHRAIECKVGQVVAQHIDEFVAKLRLVRKDFPAAIGTIVSGVSFTPGVAAHAAAEGIQLTVARDLAAQLIDGHAYTVNLLRELESDERYALAMYVEPSIGDEASGASSPAFETIDEWLRDSDWNQLTLLGDVGTGKSFLARMTAHRLALAFQRNPFENPLPIFIDLRLADREMSLEGLVLTHLTRNGLGETSFAAFHYSLSQGHIVLILDGFDEMASRITPQVTARNFNELARAVTGRAKVLLTCRTHYFRSRTEEEEVILGSAETERAAQQLYWDLIARRGFRIAYLRPFEMRHIEDYVRRASPANADDVLKRIRKTYNLMELSQRPMLLDMITKSIDALRTGAVDPARLYTVFTDAWIHRDSWREVLDAKSKLAFVTGLAKSLWNQDAVSVHYSALAEHVHANFAAVIANPRELIEIDAEVRTASFLTRDEQGHYGFAHKSYAEFFLARDVAAEFEARHVEALDTRRFTPELISFVAQLSGPKIEPMLQEVLCSPYRPRISENALVCLYGIRKERALNEIGDETVDRYEAEIELPAMMYLDGADLTGAALQSAQMSGVSCRGARLSNAILAHARLIAADFSGAVLTNADLTGIVAYDANFSGALLDGCNLDGADLRGASLREASTRGAFVDTWRIDETALREVLDAKFPAMPVFKFARTGTPVSSDELERIFATMQRRAAAVALRRGVDVDDLIDAVVGRLISSSALVRMDGGELREFIDNGLDSAGARLAAQRRREISYDELGEEGYLTMDPTAERMFAEELLERLRPDVRRLIRKRYIEGGTVSEIAREENLSESTVYRSIKAGLRVLRGFA